MNNKHFDVSRLPKRPTVVICAPQGSGKTRFGEAVSRRFNSTSVFDGDMINGIPTPLAHEIPSDGALILGTEIIGGDLEIIAHTQAGFDALVDALGVPRSRREIAPGKNQVITDPEAALKALTAGIKGGVSR